MGALISAGASLGGAAISAAATKEATKLQIAALEKQAQRMYEELDPEVLKGSTLAQDIQNVKDRLGLQATIDPALLESRYVGQNALLQGIQGLGKGEADTIASLAAESAKNASPELMALKNKLIDAAMTDVSAGAALPPGVQAELVKAGLEQGALVGGSADPRGIGGNITRKLIGERALALDNERKQRAAALAQNASALEQSRTSLLASLFPALQGQNTSNIGLATGALNTSATLLPDAGLSGADILNLAGARVGAGNQLAQSGADAAGRAAMAQGQIWGQALGSAGAAFTSPNSQFGSALDKWGTNLLGLG